ncbi:MAG TPA: hypothetical protein VFH68_08520 [Polyangia bacterium]|jgi:hypothetical protein|nr:hypothetical protein [Polyangia bacterium]
MKRFLAGWLAVPCGLMSMFLLGCPGTLDPGVGAGGMMGTNDNCQVQVLKDKCALAGCHAAGTPAAGLDLQSADIATRLVDHDTGDAAGGGQCSGMKLLNGGASPATGVFIDKITTPVCGSPMPLGGSLTAAQKTCLTDWANTLTAPAAFIGEDRP